MQSGLDFEQVPPISVPSRFFLTAPVFALLAGLLLCFEGERLLQSRWVPETLAWVHLMTAGFMLQAMCGAVLQFVPVAAGMNVPRAGLVAGVTHPLLAAGCVLLVAGFLTGRPIAYGAAVAGFAAGGGVFLAATGSVLWRTVAGGPTVQALRIALPGLAVAIGIGSLMAYALGSGAGLPLIELTGLHAAAGFGAWGLALVVGVSLYVVPMFQMTPAYPRPLALALPPSAAAGAMLAAVPLFAAHPGFAAIPLYWLLAAGAVFALATLRLQGRRRRRVTDPTFWYFRGAMILVLLAAGTGTASLLAAPALSERFMLSLGILIIGAFVAVISGMLYKIVPFINWLHLQRATQAVQGPGSLPPGIRSMIPESAMRRQMVAYFVALAVVLAAAWRPELARPAGLAWAFAAAWLLANLAGGMRRYGEFRDRIREGSADRES